MLNIEVPDIEKRTVTLVQPECDKQKTFTIKPNVQTKADCNCDNKGKSLVSVQVTHKNSDDRKIIYIDTIPSHKKSNMTIINSSDDQEVVLKMKDGKIVELEIDGQKIDEEDYDEHLNTDSFDEPDLQSIIEEAQEQMKHSMKDHKESIKRHLELIEPHGDLKEDKDRLKLEEGRYEFHFDDSSENLSKLFEEDGIVKWKLDLDKLNHGPIKWRDQFGEMKNLDSLLGTLDRYEGIVEFDSSLPQFEMHEFDFPSTDGFEFHHDRDFSVLRPKTPTDKLIQALFKDGFLQKDGTNKIELSGKHLKINGEKQPSNIYTKYKKIYEDSVGHTLSKDSKIKIDYQYNEADHRFPGIRNRTRI